MTSLVVAIVVVVAVVVVIRDAAGADWTGDVAIGDRCETAIVDVAPRSTRRPAPSPARRQVIATIAAVVVPVAVVAVLLPWRDDVSVSLALSLQLLAVVTIAAWGGLWPGMATALGAPLLVNWFLVPPYGSFHIGDRQNEVTLVVFLAAAGAVSAFVSISAERAAAAERRQVDAETTALARSDALRASLLRAVSHDLRTPLANIKAAVSSLREHDITWSDTDRDDFLEAIEANTDRLTAIVTNLLDLSKLQTGTLQPALADTSVEEVVAAALGSIDTDAGPDIQLELPDDLAEVRTDPALLERVVANLVTNALQWSPAHQSVRIAAHHGGDRVELSIVDHGPGIAPDQRRAVRQPFQRLRDAGPGGVGLGLAIADQMTTAVGAELRLQDTPGGGLTAVIDLPARREVASA